MAAFDFSDPATDAYSYSEAVADALGDEVADAYFQDLTDELFELHPGLREHFSDLLMTELAEEMHRLGAHHSAALVELIRAKWGRE